MDYIPRAIEPTVSRFSEFFKVVAVTGPRQVGKTTMLRHLMKEEHERSGIERSYVSLDNISIRELAQRDPALFLQRYKPPVLIDEIQYAPQLFPYIKIAVDEDEVNGRFWITGSQPFHLMKELSESLAGRVGILQMYGLSHAERCGYPTSSFLPAQSFLAERFELVDKFPDAKQTIGGVFDDIAAGGFPGISQLPQDMRGQAYESFVDTYLLRDVRDLGHVGDMVRFQRFLSACASLTGRPVVYSELARIADIDSKTAKAWLSVLVGSHLVKLLQPYSNNLLKRLVKQPVLHFMDTGLAAYLAGWESARALELGAMSGHIYETYVYQEILKSYTNLGMKPNLFFFRNNDKKEIDLLLEKDGEIHPIEVKETASPKRADLKNFSALAPLESTDVPEEFESLKRKVGFGCELCLTNDTFPITEHAWAFPVWAI